MSKRDYTVGEIDELRRACEDRYVFGTTFGTQGLCGTFSPSLKVVAVEEMIRTYVAAGITAKDIYDADKSLVEATEESGVAPCHPTQQWTD